MKYKMKFAAAEKNKHQSHYQGQIIQNQYILRLGIGMSIFTSAQR